MEERSARRQELFQAALDLPADERAAFLQRQCADDPGLREEVDQLLSHYSAAGQEFLETPVFAGMEGGDEDPLSVGSYRIERRIGEGGMGIVYEAVQERPHRRVAIKVLRPGLYGDSQLRRFRLECEVLGQLSHPSIAQVIEAGVAGVVFPRGPTAELAFMAMELVEGRNVLEHAEVGALETRARLELFARICDAVEHAHQQAVIHRDLKPGNIVVDPEGNPKVLDFGVARVTGGEDGVTRHTRTGDIVGTIRYMSPEQLRGDQRRVDVRSDVYSLGVILFELLSGESPHGDSISSIGDIALRLSSREVPRLSAHGRSFRGDLEAIAATALAPEPADRYPSAAALAADVRAYLDGEPLLARGERARDILRRLARRHRTATAVALTTLLLVTASSLLAWFLYSRERQARTEASERLWESYLAQASDRRASGRKGRRFENLQTLRKAAEIRPSIEVRDELIATLALGDVELIASGPDGANSSIRGLDVSDRVAVADPDGVTRILSLPGFEEITRLQGPGPAGRIVIFSRDGRYLAVKYHDAILVQQESTLWVWDLRTSEPVFRLDGRMTEGEIVFGEFEDVGRWIAFPEIDGRVHLYSLDSGDRLRSLGPPMPVGDITADARREQLAVGARDGTVAIWDLKTGERTFHGRAPGVPSEVAWLPDGKLLVGADDGTIHHWDPATDETVRTLRGHEQFLHELDLSTDGAVLASSAWDASTRLWEVATGRSLLAPIQAETLSGHGDRILTRGHGVTRLYRYAPSEHCRRIPTESFASGMASASVDRSGRILVTTDWTAGLQLFDLQTGERLTGLPEARWKFGWIVERPRRRLIAFKPGSLLSFPLDLTGAEPLLGSPEELWAGAPEGTPGACIDPALDRAFVTARDGNVLVDLGRKERVLALPSHAGVFDPALHPSGRFVFVGARWSGKGEVRDLETGDVVMEVEDSAEVVGTFSPDGALLVLCAGSTLTAYEVGSWHIRYRIEQTGRSNATMKPVFSGDGRWMAHADVADVVLYEAADGRRIARLTSPDSMIVKAVALTPDDARVVATLSGGLIYVWELAAIRAQLAKLGLDWG